MIYGGACLLAWFVHRYDEVCRYNFNVHRYQSGLGHFTQIIWKASTELGIGKYTGRSGGRTCTYIAARYKDAGNVNSPDTSEAMFPKVLSVNPIATR